MEKLTKRKNARSKGKAQLKPKRRNGELGTAYILTDVKATLVTENFYQAIPVSILKYYMPNGMCDLTKKTCLSALGRQAFVFKICTSIINKL